MLLAYGFLRKIFEVFEKYRTSIDMITTSEVAVSLTIDSDTNLQAIVKELEPTAFSSCFNISNIFGALTSSSNVKRET